MCEITIAQIYAEYIKIPWLVFAWYFTLNCNLNKRQFYKILKNSKYEDKKIICSTQIKW